jgi:Cu(I)/Ag(I) efflux system membrane fusion protein
MASPRWVGSLAIALSAACSGGKADDGTLLSPYLAIGDALAADIPDPLPELGPRVTAAAESRKGQPGVDALVEGAGHIGTQDLEAARTAYAQMSQGMIEYLEAHPDEQTGHVIIHCPMTFGGKGGLWVQKQGKIMNPYEGARMLHCGDKLTWGAALPKT